MTTSWRFLAGVETAWVLADGLDGGAPRAEFVPSIQVGYQTDGGRDGREGGHGVRRLTGRGDRRPGGRATNRGGADSLERSGLRRRAREDGGYPGTPRQKQ